jgi:UDP-3-O-[3-hydroxymyristoyl] glucosamine N-acyltransferase
VLKIVKVGNIVVLDSGGSSLICSSEQINNLCYIGYSSKIGRLA